MNIQKGFSIFALAAVVIFAFVLGINYQRLISNPAQETITPTPTVNRLPCTMEAKICPDGSSVGRVPPDCEFAPCPDETVSESPIQFCGGIAAVECDEGYTCQLGGDYPDAGGVCVKGNESINYTCPDTDWVDCMPGPDRSKNSQCTPGFLNWAEVYCPEFKGAAY